MQFTFVIQNVKRFYRYRSKVFMKMFLVGLLLNLIKNYIFVQTLEQKYIKIGK